MESIIIAALIGFLAFLVSKKPWNSVTVRVTRITDDGEQLELMTNLSAFESAEKKKAKVDGLLAITDGRKAFTFDRMQKLIADEQAKQGKLKAGA